MSCRHFIWEIVQKPADALDLLRAELRINRQRQGLGGEAFGRRKRASTVTELPVGRLKMYRHRIMDAVADARPLQPLPRRVASGQLDRIDVIDVTEGVVAARYPHPARRQQRIVKGGASATCFGPGLQVGKLDAENGGL